MQVTLTIDGVEVNTQDGRSGAWANAAGFVRHRFDVPAEPGRPTFVPAKFRSRPTNCRRTTCGTWSCRWWSALPVVFVDQYGDGRTRRKPLRRNLPFAATAGACHFARRYDRQLVQIRHTTVERAQLAKCSKMPGLVVMAGVVSPDASVPLLRELRARWAVGHCGRHSVQGCLGEGAGSIAPACTHWSADRRSPSGQSS